IRVDDIPGLVKFAAVYEPDPANARVYDEQFEEFRDFYRRMKPIYRRLNGRAAPRG
ncbi:MAG: hypothetical protein FJ104_14495, partial [Deltaproteobacteria bacterium]|nr:hypothetical protein [Deltaproteobacteria bacterium]